jgi:hypothetical protein
MMICTDRSGHHSLTTILSRLGPTPPSRPSEEAEAGSESGNPTSMFKARNGATDLDPSPAVSGESRLSRCDRRTPDSSWLSPEQLAAGCGSSWPAATLPTGACKLHTIRFYVRFIHTVPSRVLGSRSHQMNGISLSAGRNIAKLLTRHPSSSVWMEAGAYSTVQPVLVRPCSFSCRTTVVSFVSPCARRRAACCLVPLTSNPLCAVHDCTLQLQSICASLVLGAFGCQKFCKKTVDSPSHRIFECMHEALNIDKK